MPKKKTPRKRPIVTGRARKRAQDVAGIEVTVPKKKKTPKK